MYNIKDIIKGRVRFDGVSDGAIMDEDGNHIADARGWGRFQYMKDGYKIHDFLAEFIADAINEKLSKSDDMIDSVMSESDFLPNTQPYSKGQISTLSNGTSNDVERTAVCQTNCHPYKTMSGETICGLCDHVWIKAD